VEAGKTPDDVIQNLAWAEALLPAFPLSSPLVQFPADSLLKTPDDVYATAVAITAKLLAYRVDHGIRVVPRTTEIQMNRQPKHVYQETLQCLEKVNLLRERTGLAPMAITRHPLRAITPLETYDLAVQLGDAIDLVMAHVGIRSADTPHTATPTEFGKSPADVLQQMEMNANLLDTIIGSQGYTSNDVYHEVQRIVHELKLIRERLHITTPVEPPSFEPHKEPEDVLVVARRIIALLSLAQDRAGMDAMLPERTPLGGAIKPNDVFNEIKVILAELISLKVHLNISTAVLEMEFSTDRTPSHVYQEMLYARRLLESILEIENGVDAPDQDDSIEADGPSPQALPDEEEASETDPGTTKLKVMEK
jgi:hypothetical protein